MFNLENKVEGKKVSKNMMKFLIGKKNEK